MYTYVLKDMKKIALCFAALISFALLIQGTGVSAVAAPPPAGKQKPPEQALEISPPILNITADPGETKQAEILLRSISNGKLIVTSDINDFVAAGEDGVPKLLTEPGESSPYSLKQWLPPFPRMALDPKQIKKLPITIKVPADAAPGGYYGVVRFTAIPPELEGTGVSLSASLGTLVMLTIKGDAKESLEVAEFFASQNGKASTLFETAPIDFTARLKNAGNVHQQPIGQIDIIDMFGNKLANVFINQPPRNILPESIRKFGVPLDESVIGNKIMFGRYTANLKVTYGSNKDVVTSSITFWVIPYKFIGIIVAILIVGFFVFRYLLKGYNKRIIRKAQGGHHRHRRR
jgi:hypothetical protein